jgi:hypothetical protein
MGQITADQSQQVMAALSTNVNWSSIDFEAHGLQNAVIRNAAEAGKQFELFLKNRARMIVGDPKSVMTKPFNPTEFIGKGWTTWKGSVDGDGLSGKQDVDQRSLVMVEIELVRFLFETCIEAGEKSITGEEKLRRLKEKLEFIRFGDNVFLGLWLDYQANKKRSILEWLHLNFGVTFFDFMGQILRDPFGRRLVLFLERRGDGTWDWRCIWLGFQWHALIPSAGCAS